MLLGVEPDFEFSAQNMQELFSFVSVGFTAPALGFYAEKVRLHRGIAPGEQLHPYARRGLQDFSVLRAHKAGILSRGLKKGKDICTVVARNAPQRGDRRAHLTAPQGAEKAHG